MGLGGLSLSEANSGLFLGSHARTKDTRPSGYSVHLPATPASSPYVWQIIKHRCPDIPWMAHAYNESHRSIIAGFASSVIVVISTSHRAQSIPVLFCALAPSQASHDLITGLFKAGDNHILRTSHMEPKRQRRAENQSLFLDKVVVQPRIRCGTPQREPLGVPPCSPPLIRAPIGAHWLGAKEAIKPRPPPTLQLAGDLQAVTGITGPGSWSRGSEVVCSLPAYPYGRYLTLAGPKIQGARLQQNRSSINPAGLAEAHPQPNLFLGTATFHSLKGVVSYQTHQPDFGAAAGDRPRAPLLRPPPTTPRLDLPNASRPLVGLLSLIYTSPRKPCLRCLHRSTAYTPQFREPIS
ncbi:uncharacterized protein CLUP02_10500 [Colletotrichum lupini]|uniref:Uncharacterized protein n=1 Tax=Colletotrichum lupini TaxID=145971 RepID=A0A9Q8SWQ6_9PEZI|nr:uncharacterized protein CLUP02_10500 [Colletotrichum lupini]UQC85004.1 hypothetical protein CLUP02_10500 [Colletotrichum lupini]